MSFLDDEEVMAFFEDPPGDEPGPPVHPALRTCVKVKETICPHNFIEENKEWLEKLLQPEARIEAMPHVLRNITKETIRILPSRYNEPLFKLFREAGDAERSKWCLQPQMNMVVVDRHHPIPQSPDKRFFAGLADKLWMIAHYLIRSGNPHGREIERVSWELRAFMAFFVRQQILAQAQRRAQAQHAREHHGQMVQAQQAQGRNVRARAQAQAEARIAHAQVHQAQARTQARQLQAQAQAYLQAQAQAQEQAAQQAQGQGQTQPADQGSSA